MNPIQIISTVKYNAKQTLKEILDSETQTSSQTIFQGYPLFCNAIAKEIPETHTETEETTATHKEKETDKETDKNKCVRVWFAHLRNLRPNSKRSGKMRRMCSFRYRSERT